MKELRTVVDFWYFGEVTVREVDLQLFYEAAKQLQITILLLKNPTPKLIKERVIFAQKKKKRVLSRFSLENNQDIIFGDTIEINENEYALTVENTENILGSECKGIIKKFLMERLQLI